MMFRGRGMGRGGGRGMGRGGAMSRSIGRIVRKVGVYGSSKRQDSFSSSSILSSTLTPKPKSSTPLSLSSSQHHKNPLPIWYSFSDTDDSDWVSVDAFDDDDNDAASGFCGHFAVGHAPSEFEVENALCSLQWLFGSPSRVQLVRDIYCNKYYNLDNESGLVAIPDSADQVYADGSEEDWAEPSLFPYNAKMPQANGSDRVYYAIHLLQTDPSVQRMVRSLSTDRAVWDAVVNNEVVRELRESISTGEKHVVQSPDGTADNESLDSTHVLTWILHSSKTKFIEVIDKITKIVTNVFQLAFKKVTVDDAENYDPFNEKLRASFMLSIIVLLIVVVSRIHGQGMR